MQEGFQNSNVNIKLSFKFLSISYYWIKIIIIHAGNAITLQLFK